MLTEIQISNNMYYLKKQIDQIESELNAFVDLPESLPELVTSANLLRLNEFLMKSDNKKTELISAYSKYSKTMEVLLLSVFEIQNEFKDILKQQSSLIPSKTKTKPFINTNTDNDSNDGIASLENANVLQDEYSILFQKLQTGNISDAERTRYTMLKNMLGI